VSYAFVPPPLVVHAIISSHKFYLFYAKNANISVGYEDKSSDTEEAFFSHFLAVILVSGSIGTYFYLSAADSLMNNLQDRLKYSAALISQTIDAKRLTHINEKTDFSGPDYQEHINLLRAFRRTNPDMAYLYVMRKIDNKVFFVIDSDETDSQAMPGEE